jgi:energy-coupling factor transporter ATP-binding protein EcfA2
MYIKRVTINNVRSLKSLIWEIEEDHCPGWHVIIGDNGSGKSTFLKAISFVLVFEEIAKIRENWNQWLRKDSLAGDISVDILHDDIIDEFSWNYMPLSILRIKKSEIKIKIKPFFRTGTRWKRLNKVVAWMAQTVPEDFYSSVMVLSRSKGLFSCSYGPFRRFSGGDKDYQDSFTSYPRLTAHLSIFGEKVALTECLDWLQQLRFKQLEKKEEGNLLNCIIEFINQSNFLPFNARIKDISSDGVTFIDGNDCELPVEELSDGYRSILSMTFDLIRQLVRVYGFDQVFDPNDPTKIISPGVVLIDEIDVHLHPTWQRRIGIWFREHFPKIQFIVTTHSPLICQAASVGTVYRLPQPGSDEQGEMITGQMLDRLLYGNVLDAYGTEVFGEGITRSEQSKHNLARLAKLNQKAKHETLTETEEEERQKLKAMMPSNPDISN